jgi:hypothetical protein
VRAGDIFIHGITQRSGTNYLSDVLLCHRCLTRNNASIWEFQHLRNAQPLAEYCERMSASPMMPKLGKKDLYPYFGNALLEFAADGIPPGCRLVLKEPSVTNIHSFFEFFPKSFLILLIRDGRDFASSAMKTKFAAPPRGNIRSPRSYVHWLRHPVATLAKQWMEASRQIRLFQSEIQKTEWEKNVKVLRYEDLVNTRRIIVQNLLEFLTLDPAEFDWDASSRLKVRGSSFVGGSKEGLDWKGQHVENFNPVGRWRQWTEKNQRLFLSIAREELLYWGYPEN